MPNEEHLDLMGRENLLQRSVDFPEQPAPGMLDVKS